MNNHVKLPDRDTFSCNQFALCAHKFWCDKKGKQTTLCVHLYDPADTENKFTPDVPCRRFSLMHRQRHNTCLCHVWKRPWGRFVKVVLVLWVAKTFSLQQISQIGRETTMCTKLSVYTSNVKFVGRVLPRNLGELLIWFVWFIIWNTFLYIFRLHWWRLWTDACS